MAAWSETKPDTVTTAGKRISIYRWKYYPTDSWFGPLRNEYDTPYASRFADTRTGVRLESYGYYKKHHIPLPVLSSTRSFSKRSMQLGTCSAYKMGTYLGQSFKNGELTCGHYHGVLAYPDLLSYDSAVYTEAYLNCLDNYTVQKAQLLSTIAELKETMEGMSKIVSGLETSFVSACNNRGTWFSKLKSKKARLQFIKDLPSYWLEWSFGIKPLLGDAQSIAEAMAEIHFDRTRPVKVQGRAIKESRSSVPLSGSCDVGAGVPGAIQYVGSADTTRKYICRVGGTLMSDWEEKPLSVAGLTVENVLPALWEIVPNSWLMDYFTNIGDLITLACAPTMSLQNPWIIHIYESTTDGHTLPTQEGNSFWLGISGQPCLSKTTKFNYSRGVWNMSLPSLTTKIPLGIAQQLNVSAVAVQSASSTLKRKLSLR